MVELHRLCDYLDELLRPHELSDYCPNGLQVQGRPQVQRLVAGVTACQALLDSAVEWRADAILVHHGYFWRGEDPRVVGMKRRRLATLLVHDMSLLAYHLPLDIHPLFGNNAQLAAVLKLSVEGALAVDKTPGLVFTGRLSPAMSAGEFAVHLERCLGRPAIHVGDPQRTIRTMAWCTGAAQSLIDTAIAAEVDGFLTGEISEQTVHVARENDLEFFSAGHHATERYGIKSVGEQLAQQFDLDFAFIDVDNPA